MGWYFGSLRRSADGYFRLWHKSDHQSIRPPEPHQRSVDFALTLPDTALMRALSTPDSVSRSVRGYSRQNLRSIHFR